MSVLDLELLHSGMEEELLTHPTVRLYGIHLVFTMLSYYHITVVLVDWLLACDIIYVCNLNSYYSWASDNSLPG